MTKDVFVRIVGLQTAVDEMEESGNEPIEVVHTGTYYFKNGKHYSPGDFDWTDCFLPMEKELEEKLAQAGEKSTTEPLLAILRQASTVVFRSPKRYMTGFLGSLAFLTAASILSAVAPHSISVSTRLHTSSPNSSKAIFLS